MLTIAQIGASQAQHGKLWVVGPDLGRTHLESR
jgi:hypothetical protein